jgi:hypothetical protein
MNFPPLQGTGISAFLLALLAFNAAAGTLHVDINSTNPVSPYGDWSTAATNIQDAVDAAGTGDLVLVNDGVYQTGGKVVYGALTNRVAVTNAVTVQSVNGPSVTVIQGYQVAGTTNGDSAIRCAYLTNGASLSGFTLTNGATRAAGDQFLEQSGGGVWCESNVVLSNCVIAGCAAPYYGGGGYSGTFMNCTLAGNGSGSGGGVNSATVIGCTLAANWAANRGGGAYGGTLSNTTIVGNSSASYGLGGGGAYGAALFNCQVISNSASAGGGTYSCNVNGGSIMNNFGGGAYGGNLTNCTLAANSAYNGGGANSSTLVSCTLTGNTASNCGGGASGGTLIGCTLTGNTALNYGGGAYSAIPYSATLKNCALNGNVVTANSGAGGGVYGSKVYNCTVVGNAATGAGSTGGGTCNCWSYNSVIYYNWAATNADCTADLNSRFAYCCSTLPSQYLGGGSGNIANEPQLASFTHLSSSSPCRAAGSSSYASGIDIDGEPWPNPPSIGCDQYVAGAITGAITASIQIDYTNLFPGMTANLVALIGGRVSASRWECDDGTIVSNRPFISRSWGAPGTYPVILRAYNDTYPAGVTTTVAVQVGGTPIHYVALSSIAPEAPYASWATAATNIQDAVDAAAGGDQIVISNGVYAAGGSVAYGSLSNRVSVTKPLLLQSANGPAATVIQGTQVAGTTNGDSAVRCVYLTNGAWLVGFTLTNGATMTNHDGVADQNGGGVWCPGSGVVSNCVLVGNSACCGGGAYAAVLVDCILATNSAIPNPISSGGGAYGGSLINCAVLGNSAMAGGGACSSTLYNCSLVGNQASARTGVASSGGGAVGCTAYNCGFTNNSSGYAGGGVTASTLSNCTLAGNVAAGYGGGAYYGRLNNCLIIGNSACQGGGAYTANLVNCVLWGNSAALHNFGEGLGGGAYSCTMSNCTLSGNYAADGFGGANSFSTLDNCIIYFNSAPFIADCAASTQRYCCSTPLSTGPGNFTNQPLFVDAANGNFRLQAQSPCINAGANMYAPPGVELDGNPRISGGTVDVGAYEFQNPASTISYAWLQQYELPMDGTADMVDSDHDGMNNWEEWRAGTDPTNAVSVLQMLSPTNGASGIVVTWQSVTNRNYYLQRSLDLSAQPPFVNVQSNIVGQLGTTSYTDTNASGAGPFFYRVGVQ